MEIKELILKINNSVAPYQVFDNVVDCKNDYRELSKVIHPDVCKEDGATEAFAKINSYRDELENGKVYKDDLGEYTSNGYWATFKSDIKNLNWSVENYRLFKQLKSDTDKNFQRYLPKDCIIQPDGSYQYQFDKRAIQLSGLVLPQEHVNWILNRILEYCAYLCEIGFVHCGINPDSVFIVPETHGIQIMSFYHLTRTGNKIGTISGRYKSWYPLENLDTKIAEPIIDLECAKRTAAYLLGDKSGMGIKFRKTHNENFINFINRSHTNPYQCLSEYRELLKNNFKKKFHLLTI